MEKNKKNALETRKSKDTSDWKHRNKSAW